MIQCFLLSFSLVAVDLTIDVGDSQILMAGDDLRLLCEASDASYGSPIWTNTQGNPVSEGNSSSWHLWHYHASNYIYTKDVVKTMTLSCF